MPSGPPAPGAGAARRRSTTYYRLVLALPLVMLAYLVGSGRVAAYWRLFRDAVAQPPPREAAFASAFVTALLWVAATVPLLYAAWEIGREHTAARRRNAELLIGLREVVRAARGVTAPDRVAARAAEFTRAPRDNPRAALALAAVAAIGVPAFFAGVGGAAIASLRTPGALVWLAGTGALMGANVYCGHRAAAYLRDEPGRWDMFGAWRRLNPARYDERARPLVRCQRVLAVVLPLWWLGGGAVVMGSR